MNWILIPFWSIQPFAPSLVMTTSERTCGVPLLSRFLTRIERADRNAASAALRISNGGLVPTPLPVAKLDDCCGTTLTSGSSPPPQPARRVPASSAAPMARMVPCNSQLPCRSGHAAVGDVIASLAEGAVPGCRRKYENLKVPPKGGRRPPSRAGILLAQATGRKEPIGAAPGADLPAS